MKQAKSCPCHDAEHYHDRVTRAHLANRVRYYQHLGRLEDAAFYRHQLLPCPSVWRSPS